MIKKVSIEIDAAICKCQEFEVAWSWKAIDNKMYIELECKICHTILRQPATNSDGSALATVQHPTGAYPLGARKRPAPLTLTKEIEEFAEAELEKVFGKIKEKP